MQTLVRLWTTDNCKASHQFAVDTSSVYQLEYGINVALHCIEIYFNRITNFQNSIAF